MDATTRDVLKTLAQRDRKHAEYIIKKMPEKWSSKGEFVHQGASLKGSHMMVLMKQLMRWSKKPLQAAAPAGWRPFLSTLADLNIPVSLIRHPLARQQYECLRLGHRFVEEDEGEMRRVKKRKN